MKPIYKRLLIPIIRSRNREVRILRMAMMHYLNVVLFSHVPPARPNIGQPSCMSTDSQPCCYMPSSVKRDTMHAAVSRPISRPTQLYINPLLRPAVLCQSLSVPLMFLYYDPRFCSPLMRSQVQMTWIQQCQSLIQTRGKSLFILKSDL